jgi:hypothetical protein
VVAAAEARLAALAVPAEVRVRLGEEGVRGTRHRTRNSKRPTRLLMPSDNGRILGRCMCRCSRISTRRMGRLRGAAVAWVWLDLCGRKA